MGVGDEAFDVAQPDLFRRPDHVAVGQHETIGRDDDARAEPAALARTAHLRPGFDAHDGGTDTFGHVDHGIGIGIEQNPITRGRLGRSR
jgi:hypothetical protein